MFRYFGLAWDPELPDQALLAQRIGQTIRRSAGWQPALSSPGLGVHAIGSRAGINEIHRLSFDRGVILGRLFDRKDSTAGAGKVDLSGGEGDRILRTNGRALIDDYWGRYVAVLRLGDGRAVLLRDPTGTLPCFRCEVDGVTVFFSWLEDLLAFLPELPTPRVNGDAVAALLAIGHLGGRETALEGVLQVLPGQLTSLHADAEPPAALWSAVAMARKAAEEDPELAAARLRRSVMDCIGAWSSCYGRILLRLSGGVDSAILLGCLNTIRPASEITCLNYHSPGSNSDERHFARLAAAKAGAELVERERDASFRLDDILAVSRTPVPEGYTGRMGTNRTDAELADARGERAMFTGAGGDSLFFQLRCTWPAADYLHRHGFGRGFVRASLDAARLGRVSLWKSMRDAVADQRHRSSQHEGIGQHFKLTRHDVPMSPRHLDRYVHPELRVASDLPIGKFHQVRYLIDALTYYDPYLREAAPEIVNPLLSQPVIELCLGLPTWLLTHGGQARALARRAFVRELPREIATRQSKGGLQEHVETILRRNRPLVRELLLDGHLVRAGLLDRPKVEATLAGRLSAIDGSVGEIHQHVALEAWLRQVTRPHGC